MISSEELDRATGGIWTGAGARDVGAFWHSAELASQDQAWPPRVVVFRPEFREMLDRLKQQ